MEATLAPSAALPSSSSTSTPSSSTSPGAAPAAAPEISKRARVAGVVLSALASLFLAFDATLKLLHLPVVTEASARLGLPDHLSRGIGLLEVALLALYLARRTAVLGAVLLTGFLGGAVAIHLRIGDPWASHTLFPVYVGAMFWGGLALRDARVRRLLAGPQ